MPSSKGTNFTPVDREARLRHKLVNNEMNPFVDAFLTVILLCMSPFIWMFAMVHDKLMFKFLNKTYIYNVSWEVRFEPVASTIQWPALQFSLLSKAFEYCFTNNLL